MVLIMPFYDYSSCLSTSSKPLAEFSVAVRERFEQAGGEETFERLSEGGTADDMAEFCWISAAVPNLLLEIYKRNHTLTILNYLPKPLLLYDLPPEIKIRWNLFASYPVACTCFSYIIVDECTDGSGPEVPSDLPAEVERQGSKEISEIFSIVRLLLRSACIPASRPWEKDTHHEHLLPLPFPAPFPVPGMLLWSIVLPS